MHRPGNVDTYRPGSVVASWIFGSMLLIFLGSIIFLLPEPSSFQIGVVRLLVALAASFLSYFFVGNIVLRGTLLGVSIGAGGGFAVFILLLTVINPFAAKTQIADIAPQVLPHDPDITKAQRQLQALHLYAGKVTGVPDSATRAGIRKFQTSHHLPEDGYLGPTTKRDLLDEYERTVGATSTLKSAPPAGTLSTDPRQSAPYDQVESPESPTEQSEAPPADPATNGLLESALGCAFRPSPFLRIGPVVEARIIAGSLAADGRYAIIGMEIRNEGSRVVRLALLNDVPPLLISSTGVRYASATVAGLPLCGDSHAKCPLHSTDNWTELDPSETMLVNFELTTTGPASGNCIYAFSALFAYQASLSATDSGNFQKPLRIEVTTSASLSTEPLPETE